MRITICGSLHFMENMREIKVALESMGHEVLVPYSVEINQDKNFWNGLKSKNKKGFVSLKNERMRGHFEKIRKGDAVLVLNYDKNGMKNYIGGNTLIELGIAFDSNKKIFLINDIPRDTHYTEEIEVMSPVVLNGDLKRIK